MCAVFPELHKFLASVEKSGLIPPECNKNWLTLVCYLTSAARNSPVYLLGDSAGMSPGCDGRNESERTQTQTMVEGIYVPPPLPRELHRPGANSVFDFGANPIANLPFT
jgi:hypothetical protein